MPSVRPVLFATALTAAAALAHAGVAAAECTLPDTADAVKYWPTGPTQLVEHDSRCDWSGDLSSCHLSGYLYKPSASSANRPAVIFVHGADQSIDQQDLCPMINMFVSHGYVVFAPYLPGVADTTHDLAWNGANGHNPDRGGFANTGMTTEDWTDRQQPDDADERAADEIAYLQDEVEDVRAAIKFLVAQDAPSGTRLVDPHKIAIMGHSFGGSLVTLASASGLSPRPAAAIDMSGAVLSWHKSDEWEDALTDAASDHEMPIFFFQDISESPTHTSASTLEPYDAAHGSGTGEASAAVFGAMPGLGSCPDTESQAACAHHRFVKWQEFVSWWDGDVLSFLARQGVQ